MKEVVVTSSSAEARSADWCPVIDPDDVDSVPQALERVADRLGEREWLRFPHLAVSVSFAEASNRVRSLAGWLDAQGVRRGDRVAIMLGNVPEWPLSWMAVLAIGAVTVPLNIRYRHADIAHVLKDSGARHVITSDGCLGLVEAAAAECEQHCLVVDVDTAFREAADRSLIPPTINIQRHDLANLQYTSGTTGFPKACMLTHDYWLRNSSAIGSGAAVGPDDVLILAQAWSYIDQPWMALMCLLAAVPHVSLERFSASGFWKSVRTNGATLTYVLGAMPALLAKQPPGTTDRQNEIRLVFCSGIPNDLHADLERRWGAPWREIYGSTETGVDLIARAEDHDTVDTGALGRPPAGKTVQVCDEHGQPVRDGTIGEIVVSGQPMMLGYWGHPEATERVLSGGAYRSGDLGFVDELGYIHHAGRIKEIIRRGGENISAVEVETVLGGHPSVLQAAVVGVPDPIFDEIPKAFVVLRPEFRREPEDETARSILVHASGRLAAFKVPALVEFREELPMTPSERVEKRKLLASRGDHTIGSYTLDGRPTNTTPASCRG